MKAQRGLWGAGAILAALAVTGCADAMIQGRTSGHVFPAMNLEKVSARLEAASFTQVKITRRSAPYEPYPKISSADRAASDEQVKGLLEVFARGVAGRLAPYFLANGLRVVDKAPDVATLSITPVSASTSCDGTGCISLLDIKVELKGRDGVLAWTYKNSLGTASGKPPETVVDRQLKFLVEAMRRDGVLR